MRSLIRRIIGKVPGERSVAPVGYAELLAAVKEQVRTARLAGLPGGQHRATDVVLGDRPGHPWDVRPLRARLTLAYVIGLLFRPSRRIAGMGIDSLVVVIVYAVGVAGLFAVG